MNKQEPEAGKIERSVVTFGDNSPIYIFTSESEAIARVTAERDAMAAEVERLHRLIEQLLHREA